MRRAGLTSRRLQYPNLLLPSSPVNMKEKVSLEHKTHRNNHKILKEFPLLPLDELQLQCAVAGRPSKDGLQFQQPLVAVGSGPHRPQWAQLKPLETTLLAFSSKVLFELGRLRVPVVSVPFSVGEDEDGRLVVTSSDSHDSLGRNEESHNRP
ncbi:hypothetical protein EYF80_003089 [Liparis tanakae]|uniref:Uncharacterized protein n=1 Tax=Liparis tanakae TaxID=230148 RepID=A0A4Z2J9M8_9TELE|nr:hypothetical protein EYF80_003089 [Liparis tanakae]